MAQDEFVVLLDNRVRFTTSEPVRVEDVIESLRGMQRIVSAHFPKAIKNLTGVQVTSAELLVTGIEDGSLIEDTMVRLGFGSQEDYHKFLSNIRDSFVAKNQDGDTVVKGWVAGVLLVALGISGIAWWQLAKGKAAAPAGLISVNGDNNVILTIGAEAYKTSPDEFQKAVESSLSQQQKKSAAKAGVQLFAPSRGQPNAGLELNDGDDEAVEIVSPETIKRMPKSIEAEDNSQDRTYKRVELKIRASDSDSETKGWAGTIDELVQTRTRIIFANPSDAGKVMYKPGATADVTVTYANAEHTKPMLIIVEKIY
ncbi:hypothetical protein [Lysobacter sp. GCM10012299]|uniref:hypothetical protein n=1 Tax=Lysobacter sp. GCM10012299 TaxID=3317333 RepID=UPI003621FAC6